MGDIKINLAERLLGCTARTLGFRLPAWLQIKLSGRPQIILDGQQLDPCLQLMLSIRRKRNHYGLCEPDPPTARTRFRREMVIFRGPETGVGVVKSFDIPGRDGAIPVRHYAPATRDGGGRGLLVFLHGGGFVIGDIETHDEACRLLCREADMHVLSVGYRLAPEHPFREGLDDALTALRWAQENAASIGADPARVSLGGDSAGGNLATVASHISAREGTPPVAQLLIYPATDASDASTPRASKQLFGKGFFLDLTDRDAFFHHYTDGTGVNDDDPEVSPLCARDFTRLPPALVVIAGFDILRDEGKAYAAALREAGNIVVERFFPELAHGFINMTGVCPAARRRTIEMARDWRALLDGADS